MELNEIRGEIDRVNDEILRLFVNRMALSDRVAAIKRENGLPVYCPDREAEILERVQASAGEYADEARTLFETILAVSRKRQEKLLKEAEK